MLTSWKMPIRRNLNLDDTPLPRTPLRLPVALSPEEVTRMIEAASTLMHRTTLMVLYATGMGRTELTRLKVGDIDSKLTVVQVREGKGQRNHDLPISPKLRKPCARIGAERDLNVPSGSGLRRA